MKIWFRKSILRQKSSASTLRSRTITVSELERFVLLQKTGMPLQSTVSLCFQSSSLILQDLEQGRTLQEALFSSSGRQMKSIGSLCGFLSLEEALQVQEKLEKASAGLETKLLKKTLYPLFLCLFSYLLLVFFETSILPSMMSYGAEELAGILQALKVCYHLLFVILATGGAVYAAQKLSASFACRLAAKVPVLAQMQTVSLARILHALCESGLSSREALQRVCQLEKNGTVSLTAKKWLAMMEQGTALEDCPKKTPWLDPEFQSFLTCGLLSSRLPGMLELYGLFRQKDLEEKMKKAALAMELFSYACVGSTALVVYQMMLVPLNMLSGF